MIAVTPVVGAPLSHDPPAAAVHVVVPPMFTVDEPLNVAEQPKFVTEIKFKVCEAVAPVTVTVAVPPVRVTV